MLKTIGIIFLLFLLLIIFVSPLRDYINNLFHREKIKLEEILVKAKPEIDLLPTIYQKDESTEAKPDNTKKKVEIRDEIMNYRLKSKSRVRQIQTALKKTGFYKGEVDGREGPQTKRAIKAFQKSKGLVVDGIVGPKTWEELEKYLKDMMKGENEDAH